VKVVTNKLVGEYLKNDITSQRLDLVSNDESENLICQKWLRDSSAKRYIYEVLYGRLFTNPKRMRILDVGGGITGLTTNLAKQHDYFLAEIMAHDSVKTGNELMENVGRKFIFMDDWLTLPPNQYDIVIANDIFPNVDQRLEIFLGLFLPQASRIVTTLTWYDTPRFYMTKRIDAEEILCMLGWDSGQLQRVLEKFSARIHHLDFNLLKRTKESVFPNGRQVCIVEFIGDLGDR